MRESRETDEVLVCMAQRLQSQLERQLTLVERLQAHGRDESVADLAELRTSLQRALRGSENLLVLGGAQQGPRARGPRSVADVLADARSGVEDVGRVGIGPAPDASIAPRAVTGLVALFTELFTHCTSVAAPLTRVDVGSARSEDGGVAVEVVVDGPGPGNGELDELNRRLGDRPIIDDIVSNRVGLFVAARLARRCGATLRVQHRRDSLAGGGIVVVVHCPPDLLDAVAFVAPSAPAPTRSWSREPARNGNGNGNGHTGNGNGNSQPPFAPTRRPDPLSDPLPGFAVRHDPEPPRRPEPPRAPVHPLDAPLPRRSELPERRRAEPEQPADPSPLTEALPSGALWSEPPRSDSPRGGYPRSDRAAGPDPLRSDPPRSDPPRSDPPRSGPQLTGPPLSELRRTDPPGSEARHTGPRRSEPGRSDPRRSALGHSGPDRPEPGRAELGRAELGRAELGGVDTGRAEPGGFEPGRSDPRRVEPRRSETTRSDPLRPDALRPDPLRSDPLRSDPLRSDPLRSDPLRSDPLGAESTRSELDRSDSRRSEPHRSEPLWHDEPRRPEDPFRPGGPIRPVQPPSRPAEPPLRPAAESLWDDEPPLRRGRGDAELFGPLTSSLRDRMRESGPTPIYEAVASAWFVDGDDTPAPHRPAGAPPTDWNTPSDAEWRAASERATRPAGPPEPSTAAGLPRRRPGTQMVAPPRHGTPAPPNGAREREPERVRERLAVYQQGLERGRHRAADTER